MIRRMPLLAKVMLALSVLSLALSYTKAGGDFLGGALKPLAAIFFMVFFIIELTKDWVKGYEAERAESLRRAAEAKAQEEGSAAEPVGDEQARKDNRCADRLRLRHRLRKHQPRGQRRDHRLQQKVQ